MLGLLGDEWTLLIIQRALLGAARYGEFATALPVSNSVLTGRLQSLTADELLTRREYQTNPPRSEYLRDGQEPVAVADADVDLGVGAALGSRPHRAAARHAPRGVRQRFRTPGHAAGRAVP